MSLPVYSRADLSRTVAIVVALFLTAIQANAIAREFPAADTASEDYPIVQALRYLGRLVAENNGGRFLSPVRHSRQQAKVAGVAIVIDFDRKPFEAAMAGIYQTQRGPAVAALIERTRKVE